MNARMTFARVVAADLPRRRTTIQSGFMRDRPQTPEILV